LILDGFLGRCFLRHLLTAGQRTGWLCDQQINLINIPCI
jgi:hypothetical protein